MPALLFFLLLTSLKLSSSSNEQSRCSASCGPLKIASPFRLRDEHPECGNIAYELSCRDNNTVLNLNNSSYHVVDISYLSIFYTIATLLDARIAHSNCSLPTRPFPMESFRKTIGLTLGNKNWVTFMNCSERIHDERYILVPCLNRINSSSFIYALDDYDADRIGVLKPKCSFLVKTPTNGDLNAHEDIFQLLRQGFSVSFYNNVDLAYQKRFFDILLLFFEHPLRNHQKYMHCLNALDVCKHDILATTFAFIFGLLLDMALLIAVYFLLCRFVFAPLCLLVFLAYKIFKLFTPIDMVERFLKNQEALSPQRYTYNEIIRMTSNFAEKIGQGGFGSVFKGKLPGGYLVAVKMMGTTMGDGEDFINEVSTIGKIHHVNIVQLIGFCVEGPNIRALIYEYMANGSLDKYIFAVDRSNRFLSIEKLHEIALSVARGLHYLHHGCNMRILHFDIKPHNILLDHNFIPKISDFGLAKLHPKGYSRVFLSAARGTIGYIAPELISRSFGTISYKSDVYSFGMLLMDMAGRRRHVDMNVENSSQVYYPSWIYDKLQEIEEFQQREGIETYENIEIGDLERKLCKVGLWCIQTCPADRPSMNEIVEMLESTDIDSLKLPPKPFFSTSDNNPPSNFSTNSFQSELSVILES